MSTRLYLTSNLHSRSTAPADGTVFTIGSASRYGLQGVPRLGPASAKSLAETSSSRNNMLLGLFISNPLAAQTISGTWKGQARVSESLVGADFHMLTHLRVVSNAEVTRGVLHSHASPAGTTVSATPGTDTYEWDTTHTNRKIPAGWSGAGASLSSVDAQAGDVLMLEVGARQINTVTTSYTANLLVGSDSASTDLPEDETTTADNWPWIEFSQTLQFLDTPDPLLNWPENRMVWVLQPASPAGQVWPRGAGQ